MNTNQITKTHKHRSSKQKVNNVLLTNLDRYTVSNVIRVTFKNKKPGILITLKDVALIKIFERVSQTVPSADGRSEVQLHDWYN